MADHITILRSQYYDDIAAAHEAGAAEVRAQIEALEPTWPRGMYGCPDDMFSRRDLRRLLNGGPR